MIMILKIILLAWLGIELILMAMMGFSYNFLLTRKLVRTIILKIYKEKSCRFGIHHYVLGSRQLPVIGLPDVKPGTLVYRPVFTRYCTGICQCKQYTFQYPHAKTFQGWKDGDPHGMMKATEIT